MLNIEPPTLHHLEHIALTNVRALASWGQHPNCAIASAGVDYYLEHENIPRH